MTAYEFVCTVFGFPSDIIGSSPEKLEEKAQKWVNAYRNNLYDNLKKELIKNYANERMKKNLLNHLCTAYRIIEYNNLPGTFLYLEVALRIYLAQ